MPSTGTATLASATVLLMVAGAGVGTNAFGVTDQLERALDGAVDGAMRDLAVGWLEVTDAHGQTSNGTVDQATLLVRSDGILPEVSLEEIVARSQTGAPVALSTSDVLRDHDGSVENGTLNEEDLVELTLNLSRSMEPDEEREITLHHPDATPLTLRLTTPNHFDDHRYVQLDVLTVR